MIAAADKNGVIGIRGGALPWGRTLKDDQQNFKRLTLYQTVIYGRKTFVDDIQKHFPNGLPNRRNVIITRDRSFYAEGCTIVHSWEEAKAAVSDNELGFVVGGAEIFNLAIPDVQRIYLTTVHTELKGDNLVRVPFFSIDSYLWDSKGDWWANSHQLFQQDLNNSHSFTIVMFDRKGKVRESYVHMNHAREQQQREVMLSIQDAQVCPFCPEHLSKYHKLPVGQGQHWALTENQWPYKHTKHHFLLISLDHAEKLADLPPGAGEELMQLLQDLEKKFGIESGALFLRFGDPSKNGGTVRHLHVQVITPDLDSADFENIKVKLGSRPKQ